jgi:hypothetical protein
LSYFCKNYECTKNHPFGYSYENAVHAENTKYNITYNITISYQADDQIIINEVPQWYLII